MRARGLRAIQTLALAALASACADPGEVEEGSGGESSAGGESEAGSTESETGDDLTPGDECSDTELVVTAPGILRGNLRGATPASQAIGCGLDGPSVFVKVLVEDRVDLTVRARGRAFVPRLALLRPGCGFVDGDPERVLACAETLPTATLLDVGPDLELLVAVGVAPDDPALELPVPEAPQVDPLEFELELEAHAVLAEGHSCGTSLGRCEAGTVCLGPGPDDPRDDIDRCRRPEADSCVAPGELELAPPGEVVELSIAPEEPHSDAHEHPCTGWRRPERVDALILPPGLSASARLEVRANDDRVGLALRGPSCLPEDALACAHADTGSRQTIVSWGGAGELAQLGAAEEAPLLFVELPRADTSVEPLSTITVELEILD